MTTLYFLNKHVHACLCNGHIVFLDGAANQYFALPSTMTEKYLPLVEDKKIVINSICSNNEIIGSLISENLISKRRPLNYYNNLESLPLLRKDISQMRLQRNILPNFKVLLTFIKSFLEAILLSKLFKPNFIYKYMLKKPISKGHPYNDIYGTMDRLKNVRIFFYTAKDKCYFDCIVIYLFLKRSGYNPNWVFGVSMPNFKAHCWVQIDDMIVSDYLAATTSFTPILAV